MNKNEQNTEPVVTQRHIACAKEFYGSAHSRLTEVIAKHFPDVPASTPEQKPSIWRKVGPGTMPTEDDGGILAHNTCGNILYYYFSADFNGMTHWCRVSDLLDTCPLPKEKTPEELDEEA